MNEKLLIPGHIKMLKEESGISDAVIKARGYTSVNEPSRLKELGFSPRQCRAGLLVPIWTTDGQNNLNILRPDDPRIIENTKKKNHDGTHPNKVIKYEFPKGKSMRLDCPPKCREQLADPSIPLWVTEGVKKGDALASHGLCAIALLGVWNFKGKNSFGGTTLSADFDHIGLDNRDVRIVFDSDVMVKAQVRNALNRLTEHLQGKKAHIGHVYLPNGPNGSKMGVDDYLASGHTIEELEALIEAPRPAPQPAKPIIKLLEEPPKIMRRPLCIINDRAYLATWLWAEITVTESVNNRGEIIKYQPPKIKKEQRLFVIRDDGEIIDDGCNFSMEKLDFDVHLPEIPPCDQLLSVNGAKSYKRGYRPNPIEIFNKIIDTIENFIDFDRSLADQRTMCEMVACYILGTYFLDAFTVFGFLWPNGDRGSGKTHLLLTVSAMAYLGMTILAGSSYATLRDMADYGATLAFDDAENLSDARRTDPDKRALLLAGNRKGSSTVSVKELGADKRWHTRHINAYCPRLFSAIKLPDTTLGSRSIVVPLIRTANREKANADPMDYDAWPHDRRELIDDLWMLGSANLPELQKYNETVSKNARLFGRSLEPWRAILTVAVWLDEKGINGLWDRMEELSWKYQNEKPQLETSDFTALVIRVLCHLTMSASSAIDKVTPKTFIFKTKEITDTAIEIAELSEIDIKKEYITSIRVGRILGQMRFKQLPRTGGKGGRQWEILLSDLKRWVETYNLTSLDPYFCDGTNGISGFNGTDEHQSHMEGCDCAECVGENPDTSFEENVESDNHSQDNTNSKPPNQCYTCRESDFWHNGGEWVCNRCHPNPTKLLNTVEVNSRATEKELT